MALTAGTKLGPYEILGPLGAGGMGEVYRARDTRLDRTVAIFSSIPESVKKEATASWLRPTSRPNRSRPASSAVRRPLGL